jgi:hypothetical protein
MKPGSAAMPLVLIRDPGADETEAAVNEGAICTGSRPGFMRTVWGDPGRFKEQYFIQHPGFISPVTEREKMRMASFGSWAAWTTSSMFQDIDWELLRSKALLCPIQRWLNRPSSGTMTSRARIFL